MPGTTAVGVGALLAMTLALVLTGCARSNPYALPEYDPTRTGSPASATGVASGLEPNSPLLNRVATPSPSVKYTPSDVLGQGSWAELGRSTASTPAERAAVAAVVKYLGQRVQLSNTWKVDEKALAAVASGQAVTSARERAERQEQRNRRSIGRFVVNVSSVQVDGNRASVTGCHFDATSEVDQDGFVLVPPPGGVLITMQLQRSGRSWRVLDWPETLVPSCDWRKP